MKKIYVYQRETRTGEIWTPIPNQTYACAPGSFRHMLTLLCPTPNQRVRRMEPCKLFFKWRKGWRPVYRYINGSFREWSRNESVS